MAVWEKPADPSVYGSMDVDMTKLLELANKKLTLTPFLVKGVAMTLAKFPQLNVLIRRNRIFVRDHVDIFVQVFSKEGEHPDLSGAKIRDAHQKTLTQIAEEITKQSEKIRSGDDPNLKQAKKMHGFLTPRLLKGSIRFLGWLGYELNISPRFLKLPPDPFGAAMISNVGMFGLKTGFAPLVPFSRTPMVLLAGEITKQPVVENDQIVIKPILTIGVTIDHRIIDGYLGGLAGGYLKKLLEEPELMTR